MSDLTEDADRKFPAHCWECLSKYATEAMPRFRTITWRESGATHTITLPDVEANGVTALGCWVKPSPIPGTPPWEWVITNMPVTAVTGMTSGYTHTKRLAQHKAAEALDFWESYGYHVNRAGLTDGSSE